MSADLASDLSLDDGQRTWSLLADRLEMFIDLWDAHLGQKQPQPPSIATCLPDGSPRVRRLALCELVKVDLEYRWTKQVAPRRLDDYVSEFPDLLKDPPLDLIYEEFQIRQQAGDSISRDEQLKKFPKQAIELRRLFGEASRTARATAIAGGKRAASQLQPGEQIDDFDLLTRLGEGAFATVFLARQRSLQRLVALKVSNTRGHEPQTLAQFDHENIVRVFDQRVDQQRGLRLLYMQYVPAGTLQPLVRRVRETPPTQRQGSLLFDVVNEALESRGEARPRNDAERQSLSASPWPHAVCWLGAKLARALEYAHRRGVVHRDIKPANVLLAADGSPKLADFNISFSGKVDGATPAAYFGGSLAYMSPEQLEACNPAHERSADAVDARSDLYSLAVVLWELLTGERPFVDPPSGADWPQMLAELAARRHAGVDPQFVANVAATWPTGLAEILMRCLHADPAARFTTAGELARELEMCLEPEARDWIHPPRNSWRTHAARFPLMALIVAVFAPNIPASIFNFLYNWREIKFLESVNETFLQTSLWANSTAFPFGIGLLIWLSRPFRVALAERQRSGHEPPRAALANTTVPLPRCLAMGNLSAVLGLTLWIVAGAAFPIAIQWKAGSVPINVYLFFLASMTLSGAVAAVYPFFAATFLCLRCFVPILLRKHEWNADDQRQLNKLGQRIWIYLILGALIPMIAIVAVVLASADNRLAMGTIAASGVVGFLGLAWLFRELQRDLRILAAAAAKRQF